MKRVSLGKFVGIVAVAFVLIGGFTPLGQAISSVSEPGASHAPAGDVAEQGMIEQGIHRVGDRLMDAGPAFTTQRVGAASNTGPDESMMPSIFSAGEDPHLLTDEWRTHVSQQADSSPLPSVLASAELASGDVREGCAPHPPIQITEEEGEDGFILGHDPVTDEPIYRPGSGVVDGSGTAEDPYVIAGWCITSPGNSQGMPTCIIMPPDLQPECGNFPKDWVGLAEAGVWLEETDAHVVVRDNVIGGTALNYQTPTSHAVLVDNASNVSVERNVGSMLMSGVVVLEGQSVDVRDNMIQLALSSGVSVSGQDITVANNSVMFALTGLSVWSSEEAGSILLEGNELAEITFEGINVRGADGVELVDNTVESVANDYALRIDDSSGIQLTGNDFQVGGIGLSGDEPAHFLHEIDETNLVDGDPVRYVAEEEGAVVQKPAGQVIVVASADVNVSGVEISNAAYGIHVLHSEDVEIHNALVEDTRYGIVLKQTKNASITDSTVVGSYPAPGIFLHDSDRNVVSDTIVRESGLDAGALVTGGLVVVGSHDNVLENNTLADNEAMGLGVWGDSTGTQVSDNDARHNGLDGIYVSRTAETDITGNTAEANGAWGILVHDEEQTPITKNTASNNTEGGIVVHRTHAATIEQNNATNNGGDPLADTGVGIYVSSSSNTRAGDNNLVDNDRAGLLANQAEGTVDATDNWWGCPEGPDEGACDPVESHESDIVYEPWRKQPVAQAGAG